MNFIIILLLNIKASDVTAFSSYSDVDVPIEAKRPRLSTYEPEEVKAVDAQLDDSARVKLGPISEQSEKSALPSAISLDKIEVGLSYTNALEHVDRS